MSKATISRKPQDKATADGFRILEKTIKNFEMRILELEKWKKEQGG